VKMKFTILSLTLKCCFLLSLISVSFETQDKKSLMEFMNSFYSSDKKAETVLKSMNIEAKTNTKNINLYSSQQNIHHKKHKSKGLKIKNRKRHRVKGLNSFRFSENKNTNGTAGQCCDPTAPNFIIAGNNTNATNATGPLEDWLLISSASFQNTQRFPPITLPNGTQIPIKVDQELFRENPMECNKTSNDTCDLKFYFRLAPQLHIYYSSSPDDVNILGTVSIQNIDKVSDPQNPIRTVCGDSYCFEIKDTVNSNWKLCAESYAMALKWVCGIEKELGQLPRRECRPILPNTIIKVVEKTITQPLIIIPLPSRHCNDGWNYQQNGDDWECDCKEGVEQSPIDLPNFTGECIDSPVKPLFAYIEVEHNAEYDTIDRQMEKNKKLQLQIYDNSFKIFHHNFGKLTTIDGAIYFCEEIVIHSPSEHTIQGKKFDMEIQFVHYGASKGDIAKQVVLSYLIEKKAGVYNKFFDDLDFFNLPNPLGKTRDIDHDLFIPKIFYDSNNEDSDLIPLMKPFSFYTYQGSLTAPPCTERTIMYVAKEPIQLSSTVIQLFQEALRVPDMIDAKGDIIVSDWVPQSNRNIQNLNGRPVFCYDHEKYCGPDPTPPKPKPVGHYEKVAQKATHYFYVNGDKPSGLPGAFVVSEKEAKGSDFKK
jgi:carbonic anhydrase